MSDPFQVRANTTYVTAGFCPECGARHDAAVDASGMGRSPDIGDLSICMECGCVCSYNASMRVVRFTDYENLSDDERFALAKAKRQLRERVNG